MIVHYQISECFGILELITKEFFELDLDNRWGDSIPRHLHRLSRRAEFFQDYALMNIDEEIARRLRNKSLVERRKYYEQSLSRA